MLQKAEYEFDKCFLKASKMLMVLGPNCYDIQNFFDANEKRFFAYFKIPLKVKLQDYKEVSPRVIMIRLLRLIMR